MTNSILKSPIETERLLLRNYLSEDRERVHFYGLSADFSKFEFWGKVNLIARNRYCLFGIRDTCKIPTKENKNLFIS